MSDVDVDEIQEICASFVADQLQPSDNPMPWKVVRSCAVWYFRAAGVDKGGPGVMNRVLRNALHDNGYERTSYDSYFVQLKIGSWPQFVKLIKMMIG